MMLYRKLLGEDFERLGESLREFHESPHRVSGELDVTHSTQLIPRIFVMLMGLPKAGTALVTTLDVSGDGEYETWTRQIGEVRLRTHQRERGGRLVEAAGPINFVFDVEEESGALVFHHYRSEFLGIPLPKRIAPVIEARAEGLDRGWRITVDIQCPRYGTICRYDGVVGWE
jgi:hypothetical protein